MGIFLKKIRVALTPREWLLKTKLSNGAVVYGKNRAGYGGRGIYIFGDSIEPEFQHLEKFLDSTGVFVDVGANTGIYSIKAGKHFLNRGGAVLSIEPFPDMLASLLKNVQANGLTNVRLRNFCAGETTHTATLWMNFNKPNSFSLLKKEEKASPLSTLVVALDDLFAWERLNRLDYLKIDAEGSEREVLSGAKKTIEKYRPIIQLEVTINDIPVELPNYLVYQAPGSLNKVYIPDDHLKKEVPKQLGWNQVS